MFHTHKKLISLKFGAEMCLRLSEHVSFAKIIHLTGVAYQEAD